MSWPKGVTLIEARAIISLRLSGTKALPVFGRVDEAAPDGRVLQELRIGNQLKAVVVENVTTGVWVSRSKSVLRIMTVFRVTSQIAKAFHRHKRLLVEFGVLLSDRVKLGRRQIKNLKLENGNLRLKSRGCGQLHHDRGPFDLFLAGFQF